MRIFSGTFMKKRKDEVEDLPNQPLIKELDEISLSKAIAYLNQARAFFEIRIENERFKLQEEPNIILPAPLEDDANSLEHVYPIHDYGDRLVTAKQFETEINQLSMFKMYYTIEKMISIWNQKIKEEDASSDELYFFLDGHLYCLRKAFEVIINLTDNWLIMDFDPGEWGNNYLATLQRLRKKDFSYPPPAPRDIYRHKPGIKTLKASFNK